MGAVDTDRVRGCVARWRFCCALQWAMGKWRQKSDCAGFDLGDGGDKLLDLRFADDVLLFAKAHTEAANSLDSLVAELAHVGLMLNASKTVLLTTEAQPPASITTPAGTILNLVCQHKWLGCMLATPRPGSNGLDVEYHLQQAHKAFHANKWILTDKNVSIADRVRYFQTVVTPVACFAAGHRVLYREDLNKLDISFRKLLRQVVGPPGGIDWNRPWHEILHDCVFQAS